MKFGPVAVAEAAGAILAHSQKLAAGKRIRKGKRLDAGDVDALRAADIRSVVVARLEPDDLGEDDAAALIGQALATGGIRAEAAATGRVNLFAESAGLFCAEAAKIDAINRADPGITLATLDHLRAVEAGRMVATVKIIPYAVARSAVEAAALHAADAIRLEPFRAHKIGVVATRLPALKPSVMDKTLDALAGRLRASGSSIIEELRVDHHERDVSAAIGKLLPQSDMVIVFGASAISDIDDVIPAAIRIAGGRIEHFGMPVDPGNLMLIGDISGKPVLGAPGCARSPAENGFDWILQRLLAGRRVTADEITGMGVGGLLMEIGTRPRPREEIARRPKFAAILLAAGQSRRMGSNKLLAELGGKPLIRQLAEVAEASMAQIVLAVTGHDAERVERVLSGAGVKFVRNVNYERGMGTSLAAGLATLSDDIDGAVILLGDMPGITTNMIDRLLEAAASQAPMPIVMATANGVRGNPVVLPRRHFAALRKLDGDEGARRLIAEHGDEVVTVELGDAAASDLDTPEALAAAGAQPVA